MPRFNLSSPGSFTDLFMDFGGGSSAPPSVVDTTDEELETIGYSVNSSDEDRRTAVNSSCCSNRTGETSESEESYTSYSTESSFGFQMDASFTIYAQPDPFDDMSTIIDSVISDESWRSYSTTKSVGSSQKMPPDVLSSISEESQQEADEHEAYLRAKMTSLWTRIQESAHKPDLSAEPSTEEDEELLKAYAVKNDTLTLLSKTTQ